jgi:competence protein ComEC
MNLLPLALASSLFLTAVPAVGRAQTPPEQGVATVEFLYVGLRDATLIRSAEGKVALIDAGPTDNIVDLLRERGISVIDVAIVSHRHREWLPV